MPEERLGKRHNSRFVGNSERKKSVKRGRVCEKYNKVSFQRERCQVKKERNRKRKGCVLHNFHFYCNDNICLKCYYLSSFLSLSFFLSLPFSLFLSFLFWSIHCFRPSPFFSISKEGKRSLTSCLLRTIKEAWNEMFIIFAWNDIMKCVWRREDARLASFLRE